MERFGLDRLLTTGAVPPGAALELAGAVAARLEAEGPATAVGPAHVAVGRDGSVALAAVERAEGGAAAVVGGLLFELLTGEALPPVAPQRARAVETARSGLVLLPAGRDIYALMTDLVEKDLAAGEVCERCLLLRGRVGGMPLVAWVAKSVGELTGDMDATTSFDSPDNFTGNFPAGALAAMLAEPVPNSKPLGRDPLVSPDQFQPDTPAPEAAPVVEEVDELDALLRQVAANPAPATPAPPANTSRTKTAPKPRKGPDVALWVFTVVLLALAVAFLFILYS